MQLFRLPRLLVRLCFDTWVHTAVHTAPYVIGVGTGDGKRRRNG